MNQCFCNRIYRKCKPISIKEYAFSGSICRIREFQTDDGLRYCLTTFSLYDYKHLHFPHYEYRYITQNLYALQSAYAILPTAYHSNELSIIQLPFDGTYKIKFGADTLKFGPVTSFGIIKSAPFADIDIFSINRTSFTCDDKWDICTCQNCPVFKRLVDFEKAALLKFSNRSIETLILFDQ